MWLGPSLSAIVSVAFWGLTTTELRLGLDSASLTVLLPSMTASSAIAMSIVWRLQGAVAAGEPLQAGNVRRPLAAVKSVPAMALPLLAEYATLATELVALLVFPLRG